MSQMTLSARFEDLQLTIARHDQYWRARVEAIEDPNGALSDGTDYSSLDRAKRGAVAIAQELFGTNMTEEELEWRVGVNKDQKSEGNT